MEFKATDVEQKKKNAYNAIWKEKNMNEILTGHVNSNGNLIGFIDGPFCGWFLVAVASCVKLNVLSPRICVASEPNVHGDIVSISA